VNNRLTMLDVKPIQNALWSLPAVRPPTIVRADILHNIHLGVLKNLMEWIQGFLGKHKRLAVFDEIWSTLPPYPGFTPPRKQYRQITMWSGTEMRGVGRVILGCFTAAMRREKDTSRLGPAAQADMKIAIRAVRALSDFCLIAQYRSHTGETIQYMTKYLQEFHKYRHVFGEFRASKADQKKAKGASKDLAETQAQDRQTTISSYFPATATQKANQASANRQEREHLVADMLGQSTFNYPKLHLLTHYAEQIIQFGRLPQYSTEITEALHKPLKEAYKRSNRVDATVQILDTHTRDHAFKMLELNLCAWDKEVSFKSEIKVLVASIRKEAESPVTNKVHPKLIGQQRGLNALPEPVPLLTEILGMPSLMGKFQEYLRLNGYLGNATDTEGMEDYRGHYFSSLAVAVHEFQGDGQETHHVRWTGDKDFRKRGKRRADWVWIRKRPRSHESNGELDGRTVGRLEGLFRIWDRGGRTHELAYVRFLRVKGSNRPHGEEGMIRMEQRDGNEGMHMVRVSDIEGMAHLIPVETDRVWLVNNRIDFTTWNELYD